MMIKGSLHAASPL